MKKRNLLINVVLVIIILSIGVTKILYTDKENTEVIKRLRLAYPLFKKSEDINAQIIALPEPNTGKLRKSPNGGYLLLSDSVPKRIHTSNELSSGIELDSILEIGSWVVKKSGSDTILIFKVKNADTARFKFILYGDSGPLK